MHSIPPPIIATAKLIKFADATDPVAFTGKQTIYVDGQLVGAAPRLAICQQLSDNTLHLYLCDEQWNILAVSGGSDIAELTLRAERWYSGISNKWVGSPYSESDYSKYLDDERGGNRCHFCGKWDWEYAVLFSERGHNICDLCVESFHAELANFAPS